VPDISHRGIASGTSEASVSKHAGATGRQGRNAGSRRGALAGRCARTTNASCVFPWSLRWRHTIADDRSASPASGVQAGATSARERAAGPWSVRFATHLCRLRGGLACKLLLLIGLCRMEKLTWLKFSVKLLPVQALTFEVSAVPKLGKLPEVDGRREHLDNQPDSLPKFARDGHGAPTKSDGCSSAEGAPDRGLSGRCGRLCRECCTWRWRA